MLHKSLALLLHTWFSAALSEQKQLVVLFLVLPLEQLMCVPNTLQNSVRYGLNYRDVSLPELRVTKVSVSVP